MSLSFFNDFYRESDSFKEEAMVSEFCLDLLRDSNSSLFSNKLPLELASCLGDEI